MRHDEASHKAAAPDGDAALRVIGVSKEFPGRADLGGVRALDAVTLTVNLGELVVILGPSGSGKTTLLNIIAGLEAPTTGEVLFGSQLYIAGKPSIGYVFQQDLLLPWRTILQNILLGAEVQGIISSDLLGLAGRYVKQFDLSGFENAQPSELSEGMRHRAAFIRTLLCNPRLLLLDEPFAALDYEVKIRLEQQLLRVAEEQGYTIVFVTHDIEEAISIADRILVFTERPGQVKSVHSIDLGQKPRDPLQARENPVSRTYFKALAEELRYGAGFRDQE